MPTGASFARTQNPDWTREEAILCLHWYVCLSAPPTDHSLEVIQFSSLLERLSLHGHDERTVSFRNPSGVRSRLQYFRRLQEGHTKGVGSVFREVWAEYQQEHLALHREAARILAEAIIQLPSAIDED